MFGVKAERLYGRVVLLYLAIVLAAVFAVSIAAFAWMVAKAPLGYEDRDGFHLLPPSE